MLMLFCHCVRRSCIAFLGLMFSVYMIKLFDNDIFVVFCLCFICLTCYAIYVEVNE